MSDEEEREREGGNIKKSKGEEINKEKERKRVREEKGDTSI